MNLYEQMAEKVLKSDALNELVRLELIRAYQIADPNDWENRDALRKVIKYYSTEGEYKSFLAEVVG